MTPKQREFIDEICQWLGIDYDGEDTVRDASDFIKYHIKEFRKVRFEYRFENKYY